MEWSIFRNDKRWLKCYEENNMNIDTLIKMKILLILLLPVLIIIIAWEQITFSVVELIFFAPLLFTLNKGTYQKIKDDIPQLNYYT